MKILGVCLVGLMLTLAGCNSEPAIYPVTGKVTFKSKAYPRLIVYMHPIGVPVTRHTMGIGETDAEGNLKFATSAGDGIAAGNYRVSFACYQTPGGNSFDALSEKPGEAAGGKGGGKSVEPVNIIPAPYDSSENSPVEFSVGSHGNRFEFDIPAK